MRHKGKPVMVKSMLYNRPEATVYYESLAECCRAHGIRYTEELENLIEHGGLAPDGRTYFEYPSVYEEEDIRKGLITLVGPGRRKGKRDDAKRTVREVASVSEGDDSEGAVGTCGSADKDRRKQTEEHPLKPHGV